MATQSKQGIFPTFFIAGFECSTFIWKDGERKDYIKLTGHDRFMKEDCTRLHDLGIGTVREAIPWPFVDLGHGRYDWSRVDELIRHVNDCKLAVIWDLFHYGLPDGCNPLSEDCLHRFEDYCHAVAEYVSPRTDSPDYFTPVNEITFFSGACTDMGWMYPFAKGEHDLMKKSLCRMAIYGCRAIREVLPEARFVHVDPLIHTVPPPDRPDLKDEAWKASHDDAFEAWDILCGKKLPELGGAPDILDVVGVNVYNFSQAQMNADGSRSVLGPQDPRRVPLSQLLMEVWDRYQRPIIIGETSGYADHRAEWLRMTMEECLKAIDNGVDLQGVTLYPAVDMPDWQSGEWAKIGIYDVRDRKTYERIPHDPYIREYRKWQRVLDRPESIEPDSYGGPMGRVQLDEVYKWASHWAKGNNDSKASLR